MSPFTVALTYHFAPMSSGNVGKVVLVSGINGYIATHIGLQLLSKGYTVRGTSRSSSTKGHLLTGAFQGFDAQFEHHEVKDIAASGVFDEAVRGVHAIIHTASPVDFTLTTVDAYFGPAVGGNLSILNSALSNAGPQMTSFVATSSVGAVVDKERFPPNHRYTPVDWNISGEALAREKFNGQVAYGASKSVAERELWNWAETYKPSFAVAAICPAVVTGPPISFPASPEKLNLTLLPLWQIYRGDTTLPSQIGDAWYIDVRDVAEIHVWAVESPTQSSGQRYLLANGKAPPQAAADLMRKYFPQRKIVVGEPGSGYNPDYSFVDGEISLDCSNTLEALGIGSFIGFEKTLLDTIVAFERQWPG